MANVFKSEQKRTFRLTPKQGERLDSEFRKSLNHNYKFYSDNASGITIRLGLMTYKIASLELMRMKLFVVMLTLKQLLLW